MKTLVYTVSDFKNGSLECIDLLKSSIIDNDFDFAIISNFNFNCKYKIFIDEKIVNYPGFLKYSSSIPSGYDQYIYLDSDILYFGNINNLYSELPLSITQESIKMNEKCSAGNYWFRYPFDISNFYEEKISKLYGINAGSFGFKKLDFIKKVRNLFEPYISNDILFNAQLEQSSFNYAVCNELNFDLTKAFNFTNITQLFAQDYPFSNEKKLYHFCGFDNSMNGKSEKMNKFIYENSNRIT